MLRCFGLICVFLLLLSSCGEEEKKVKVPDNVLDQEKFSELLVDFALAESASAINIMNLKRPGELDTVYAFNPLIDNNVKRETLDTTLYFYSHHPKEFKKVYEMVLEKLSKMQASRK
jgi:hypothetical protein